MPKKIKEFQLDAMNTLYLAQNTVKIKSVSLRLIIAKFRSMGLKINFKRTFSDLQKRAGVSFDMETIEYFDSQNVGSFSFVLNCLLATAKEHNIIL
jgi:hypothetical protein